MILPAGYALFRTLHRKSDFALSTGFSGNNRTALGHHQGNSADFKTSVAGAVVVDFSGVESFDPTLPIRLQDHINGSMTDLRQSSSYVFAHDPANSDKRFSLVFGYPDGISKNAITEGKAFISSGSVFIDVPGMEGETANIDIYNAIGQLISTGRMIMHGAVRIDAPQATGIYIVRVAGRDQNFVTRVVNK